MATVRTKEELKAAKEKNAAEIVVVGDFADKLKRAQKVALLGGASIIALSVALGAATISAPATGGLSYFVAAPVAALTGAEITAIIAVSAIGLALVVAVFRDYEEISYESGKLTLKKKNGK